MKIAVIGNFDKEITPAASGGTEVFTYSLVNELSTNPEISAIDVYGVGKNYFTSEKVTFIPILPTETHDYITSQPLLAQLDKNRSDFLSEYRFGIANKILMRLYHSKYDIIHDNSTSLVFNALSELLPSPILTTLHTNVNSPSIVIPFTLDLLNKNANQYFVAIANHQAKFAQQNNIPISIVQTIHNGIAIEAFTLVETTTNQETGLWIGRISRKHNKGAKEAMEACNRIAQPLTVLTSVDDDAYFQETIKPQVTDNITFLPKRVGLEDKNTYYQQASFFLYPIIWEEPFGLVFLEAMACGTPVIAFAKGAVPEIIEDGKTGFIVNPSDNDIRGDFIVKQTGIAGLCEAIKRLRALSPEEYLQMRKNCRVHVENKFTVQRMAQEYAEVYKKLIPAS